MFLNFTANSIRLAYGDLVIIIVYIRKSSHFERFQHFCRLEVVGFRKLIAAEFDERSAGVERGQLV